jgi:hypothetical protein
MNNYAIRKCKVFYSFKEGIEKIEQVIAFFEDDQGIYHVNMIDMDEIGFCYLNKPFLNHPYENNCELSEDLRSMLNTMDVGEVRDCLSGLGPLETIPLTYVRLA